MVGVELIEDGVDVAPDARDARDARLVEEALVARHHRHDAALDARVRDERNLRGEIVIELILRRRDFLLRLDGVLPEELDAHEHLQLVVVRHDAHVPKVHPEQNERFPPHDLRGRAAPGRNGACSARARVPYQARVAAAAAHEKVREHRERERVVRAVARERPPLRGGRRVQNRKVYRGWGIIAP